MARYLLQRLLQGVLVLWAAWTLSFILLQLLPGDAIMIKFLDPSLGLSAEQIAQMRKLYGEGYPAGSSIFRLYWRYYMVIWAIRSSWGCRSARCWRLTCHRP